MRDEPRFRLGNSGTGQNVFELEGLREKSKTPPEAMNKVRANHEFLPDAQSAFDQTLKKRGYERMSKLENGYEYPSVDEWIEMKIGQGQGWVRSYPAFIQEKRTKDVLFCKSRIKQKFEVGVGSLAKEAAVLREMKDLPAPRLREYIPRNASANDLETLIVERVDFSEGSVLLPEEWTPEAARNTARVVRSLEAIPLDAVPKEVQEQRDTIDTLIARNDYILRPELKRLIQDMSAKYAPHAHTVFIHGDIWPKNIIVGTDSKDPKITLVDWELAGLGYAGQDIARVWWGISANGQERSGACKTLIRTYLEGSTQEEREAQLARIRFGLMFEVLDRFDQDNVSVLRDEKSLDEATANDARNRAEKVYQQLDALLSLLEEVVEESR